MQLHPDQHPGETAEHFAFEVPLASFTKGSAPAGKQRRVAGVISTETPDLENETVLQRGLNFDRFLKTGWLNDNHSKMSDGVLGYPESVQQFPRGAKLPNGDIAPANCTWAEGFLLNTKKADNVWELAQALQGTGRHLGFSVEGSILKRQGVGGKVIARADIHHVALTHAPVNTQSKLEALARSLDAIEKTLTVGDAATVPVDTPTTGEGAGRILSEEDLEHDLRPNRVPPARRRRARKSMTDREAMAWLQGRLGATDPGIAQAYLTVHKALQSCGRV